MDENGIKSVPLVTREDNLKFAGLEAQNIRYIEKVKNPKTDRKISGKIVAISLSLTLAATAALGVKAHVENVTHEASTEVVYITEVPDNFDNSSNLKILVQANGEAFYENESGERFKTFNEIDAENMAIMTGYQGKLNNSRKAPR